MSLNNTPSLWYCISEDLNARVLSESHELIVSSFLEDCSASPASGARLKSLPDYQRRAVALKFLRARKWDVSRAVELFRAHEKLRRVEGFEHIDPCDPGVRDELLSGKLTILSGADSSDAVVALFTACRHRPPETTHRDTLKSLIFQLDAALAVESAQEHGLVFVYDMTASKYGNFDYDLSIKILNMLKGTYPARLNKVLIVTAPIWFKAPFQVLRMFVREKLRDRVFTVDRKGLAAHLDPNVIPQTLGGRRAHDHQSWLAEACRRMGRCLPPDYFCPTSAAAAAAGSSLPPSAASDASSLTDEAGGSADWMADCSISMTDSVADGSGGSAGGCSRKRSPSVDAGGGGDSPSKKRSGVDADGDSVDSSDGVGGGGGGGRCNGLAEFAARVSSLQREGLVSEFNRELGPDRGGDKQCEAFKRNREKNRYADVPCLDASRVQLKGSSDYVHANWVDGYQQPNAYVCTQGPLSHTVPDFWAMVWQCDIGVVVMTTRLIESRRSKCALYWPQTPGETQRFGDFSVTCESVEDEGDMIATELAVSYRDSHRSVSHLQFTSWPDFGIPHAAGAFLQFLDRVRSLSHQRGGPVLVHCSAGIGRTGTFLTVDIALRRLADTGEVDLLGTVRRLREQRAGSIQTAEQYVFCHIALLEFAAINGLLPTG